MVLRPTPLDLQSLPFVPSRIPHGYEVDHSGFLIPRHRPLAPCHARLRLPGVTQIKRSAFTFIGTANNSTDASGTTLDIAYTATAGALLVGWVKHEGTSTTLSIARSDASESWTAGGKTTHAGGEPSGQFFYLLACTGGAATYRFSCAARAWRSFILFEYTYSGTASLDGEAGGTGTSANPSSGNMTTTATDGIAFGGYGEFTSDNGSSHQINGVAADGVVELATTTFSAAWRRAFTSGFTGAATCTLGGSAEWVCRGIAFKADAGTQSFSYTAAGGMSLGGAAAVNRVRTKESAGGVALAGLAPNARVAVKAAAGGLSFAGAASFAKGATVTPAGGLAFAGAADLNRLRSPVCAGGVQFGGAADVTTSGPQQLIVTPDGGITLAGASPATRARAIAALGGVQFGGAADAAFHEQQRVVTAAGGLQFGGAAGYATFIEGGAREDWVVRRRRRR